ncbi:MAG: RsmD family RNA methyltransferase, partial [Pseudonocardiaceae bacterium]|nr:RsmD family RNA methyltransferase [Pseudonocardiaceae bacterium]
LAGGSAEPFDLVLADPPYAAEDLGAELGLLVAGGWVGPGSFVIVERSRRAAAVEWPEPLAALRVRHYGETSLYWSNWRDRDHCHQGRPGAD